MEAAAWLVNALAGYAALGALFALGFVTAGIGVVDPAARGSSVGFRILVFPGAVALWPLLMTLWIRKSRYSV